MSLSSRGAARGLIIRDAWIPPEVIGETLSPAAPDTGKFYRCRRGAVPIHAHAFDNVPAVVEFRR